MPDTVLSVEPIANAAMRIWNEGIDEAYCSPKTRGTIQPAPQMHAAATGRQIAPTPTVHNRHLLKTHERSRACWTKYGVAYVITMEGRNISAKGTVVAVA